MECARTLTATKGFSQRGLTDKERPCHLENLRQTETAPKGRFTHGIVLQAETDKPRDRVDDACSASSFYKNTTCGLKKNEKMKKSYHIRKTLLYFSCNFFTNHFILTFLWVKCVISIIVEITLLKGIPSYFFQHFFEIAKRKFKVKEKNMYCTLMCKKCVTFHKSNKKIKFYS